LWDPPEAGFSYTNFEKKKNNNIKKYENMKNENTNKIK